MIDYRAAVELPAFMDHSKAKVFGFPALRDLGPVLDHDADRAGWPVHATRRRSKSFHPFWQRFPRDAFGLVREVRDHARRISFGREDDPARRPPAEAGATLSEVVQGVLRSCVPTHRDPAGEIPSRLTVRHDRPPFGRSGPGTAHRNSRPGP